MSRSMTGFGSAQKSDESLGIMVEVRSVNNRFLDISLRLPKALYPHETEIRNLIKNKIRRGRISLFIKEEFDNNQAMNVRLDHVGLRHYANELKKLQTELGIKGELKLEHILSSDDLFKSQDDSIYDERLWKLGREALISALDQLVETGENEGERLCSDIVERLTNVSRQLEFIKNHAENQVEKYAGRLKIRLQEILTEDRIDENRLETEIALAADKLDISEEIVRLESHLEMFSNTIDNKEPVGKTLGFVLQEMSREANTIASKSWLIDISKAAIKIKELLEQVREQVQNLE